jgi:hypothetical protein
MPAPITWYVWLLSSLAVSNLQFTVQVAGIEGGWTTLPGLVTPPYTSPAIPARAVRVLRDGGSPAPGEQITALIAPAAWPAWAVPDPSELRSVAGLYRW